MSNSALVFALAALKKANTANERIDNLPLPMIFKGSLGTGGTIETLPAASTQNEGFVYIVITDGTYAGQTAKAGDTFVSDGSSWVLVPSGDEPSVIDDSVTSTALTWSSKKISDECKIKSFTYTGDDSVPRNIQFPEKPKMILGIFGYINNNVSYNMLMTPPNEVKGVVYAVYDYSQTPAPAMRCVNLSYDSVNNILTIDGANINFSLNIKTVVYTVYYI